MQGLNPSSATRTHSGWFGLLDQLTQLTAPEALGWQRHRAFLDELSTTAMSRSYKFVLLRALIHDGTLLSGTSLDQLAATSHDLVRADPRLIDDARTEAMPEPASASTEQWARMWRANPVNAWTGGNTDGAGWWRVEGDRFVPTFEVPEADVDTFVALVAELVEWRLGDYLLRRQPSAKASGVIECAVSHAGGQPIIRYDRGRHPSLPEGTTTFLAEGEEYEGDFVKIALNVARRPGGRGNALHALLRGWFGPSAGLPGSRHRVLLEQVGGSWVMRPLGAMGSVGGTVLPFFPSYEVACGAFEAGPERVHAGMELEVRDLQGEVRDPAREFVAVARGESMAGEVGAVHDGDLVLMRWVRDRDRAELVGHRVLIEYDGSAALKSLDRDASGYVLASDNLSVAPVRASSGMTIVAEYVRTVDQREINPLAEHIGTTFRRDAIAPLYNEVFDPGNWRSGHVSLGPDVILFITLIKTAMAEGAEYAHEFDSPGMLVWTSQTSTGPDTDEGREILDAPGNGRRIHAWVRGRKTDVAFEYRGLIVPLTHTGDRPMSVRFRLLTPLDREAMLRLGDRR